MVETFQIKLSDSKLWRWTALILLASAMFFAYIFVDILSPLQEFLQTQRGWDPVAYGHYAGSEPFLNVFVFFLIFAGIILDKMGVRFTAVLSGMVMVVGAGINYYAVSDFFVGSSLETFFTNTLNLPQTWWNVTPFYAGMPASAKLSAIGFMIFGCGAEMAGITVSRGIVKWFKGNRDGHCPCRCCCCRRCISGACRYQTDQRVASRCFRAGVALYRSDLLHRLRFYG